MIRRDIFSVKVYDTSVSAYVHSMMTTDATEAKNYASVFAASRDGMLHAPKIVHPSQSTVDAFVSVGNTIR